MSPEEAGEELLMGRPYVVCNYCYGDGLRPVAGGDQDETKSRTTRCNVCSGKGNVARPAYFMAAQLLGAPIPPQPKGKP